MCDFSKKYSSEVKTLKEMKNKLRELQVRTIKESVYANNKNIKFPSRWKNEDNLAEDLEKDKQFLSYLRNSYKNPIKISQDEKEKSKFTRNVNKIDLENLGTNKMPSSRPFSCMRPVTKTYANYLTEENLNTFTNINNTLSDAHARASRFPLITSGKVSNKSRIMSTKTNKTVDKAVVLLSLSSGRQRSAYPKSRGNINTSSNNEEKEGDNEGLTEYFNTASNINTVTKAKKKEEKENTDFLFLEYYQKFNTKAEIKSPKVNKLFEEVKSGPYSTHCPSCNRRNIEFFDKLRPETAINYLNNIREENYLKLNKN